MSYGVKKKQAGRASQEWSVGDKLNGIKLG